MPSSKIIPSENITSNAEMPPYGGKIGSGVTPWFLPSLVNILHRLTGYSCYITVGTRTELHLLKNFFQICFNKQYNLLQIFELSIFLITKKYNKNVSSSKILLEIILVVAKG